MHLRTAWTLAVPFAASLATMALAGCAGGGSPTSGLLPGGISRDAGGQLRGNPAENFVKYFPVTGIDGDLLDITVGPDGALWFTETSSNAIGRMDKKGNVSKYPLAPSLGEPIAITNGPDGNVWFTVGGGSQQYIGKITPSGGITTYGFGLPFSTELDITTGPDGNLWFTDFYNNKVGKATPSGVITEYPLPDLGSPIGITVGPDHRLWICDEGALHGNQNIPGRILRMTTSLKFQAYPLTPQDWQTAPQFIALGKDKNLWFTEQEATATPFNVERITKQGTITKYNLPAGAEPPYRITAASDGNVWLTESETYVDSVTPDGAITRYVMPHPPGTSLPPQPRGIVSGPKRDLWWVETSSGSIGQLQP